MRRRLWTWVAVIVLLFIGLVHPPFPDAAAANSTTAGWLSAGLFSVGVFSAGIFSIGVFSISTFVVGVCVARRALSGDGR